MRLHLFLRVLGTILIHLFDGVLLRLAPRAEGCAGTPLLLLVRLDHIGDAVLWLPSGQRVIEAWHRRGYRVVVVIGTECAALLRGVAGIDEVRTVDRRRFRLDPWYRVAFLLEVRGWGAEVAMEPTYTRVPSLGDAVVRASGAVRRIAWEGDHSRTTDLEKRLGDRAYTELLTNPVGETSELRRNEAFLDRLNIPPTPFERFPLPRRMLAGTGTAARTYVLMPGASSPLRRWPAPRFARLAERIYRKTGWTGVICGGAGDRVMARSIAAGADAPLIDCAGSTSLDRFVEVIADSAFVLSNETSAVHIAAALQVPCVCVTGGGHFGRFVPYSESRLFAYTPPRVVHQPMPCFDCNWVCHERPAPDGCAPCVDAVTVEVVAAEVMAVLEAGMDASAGWCWR